VNTPYMIKGITIPSPKTRENDFGIKAKL